MQKFEFKKVYANNCKKIKAKNSGVNFEQNTGKKQKTGTTKS